MRPTLPFASLTLLLACAALGAAENPPQKAKPKKGKEDVPSAVVVVSATRTERTEQETTATVSVVTEKEIENRIIQRPAELVRFEPGVDVGNKPDRQGATSFTIRGIGGNRVLILVDGVNLPDGPEAGRSYSRDLVDLETVKRVEILRGPSSALYGSDALGGVVTYATKEAKDYLGNQAGVFGSLRTTYASVNNATAATVTGALAQGAWDAVVLATRRQGHEVETALGTPNPQTFHSTTLLGKVGFQANAHNHFNLGIQGLTRTSETHLLSNEVTTVLGPPPTPPLRVLDYRGNDESKRQQVSLAHTFRNDDAYFQHAEWRLFYQSSNYLEHTNERRDAGAGPRLRLTDYRFEQTILGLRSQVERQFSVGSWAHHLLLGLDGSRMETKRPYDRSELNLSTGAVTKTVGGLTYPSKVCPDSSTTNLGAFVQGEVVNPSGRWTTLVGLRFDTYHLDPKPDADFARSNVYNLPIRDIRNQALSPKVGLLAKLNDTWTAYGQYSRGFRNPPYDNANIAFTMQAGPDRYAVIPNPDLQAEKSYSVESGLRGEGTGWDSSVAVFYNRYKDFITDTNLGRDPKTNAIQLQYINLQRVRIQGIEAKVGCAFWEHFRFQGTLAYAEGDDLNANQPIDTVAPFKSVVGFGYRAAENRWGADLIWTGVARKNRVPPPSQSSQSGFGQAQMFRSPGYGSLDLMAHWNLRSWLRIQAGAFNLTDQTHWRWEDVRGFGPTDPALPRYSQPGRNVTLGVTLSWK